MWLVVKVDHDLRRLDSLCSCVQARWTKVFAFFVMGWWGGWVVCGVRRIVLRLGHVGEYLEAYTGARRAGWFIGSAACLLDREGYLNGVAQLPRKVGARFTVRLVTD